jgi:hypothetical protein
MLASLFLRPSSLDIFFSPYPILLARFHLGTIFLVSVCLFVFTFFLLKLLSFKTSQLDMSFVLTCFFIIMSFSWHLFLLTFSYLAI